ncbi:MAG: zf-HC2 domain-containing protein [Clostridia bacterium]|nr:zf-HC2 domain-containing protein [Clostridia bacterium]
MTCEVIRDLIPMYIDKTASDETVEQVKIHLQECEDCRRYCEACKKADKRAEKVSKKSLEKTMRDVGADISQLDQQYALLSRKLKTRKIRQTLISIFVLLGMAVYVTLDIINTVKRKEKN